MTETMGTRRSELSFGPRRSVGVDEIRVGIGTAIVGECHEICSSESTSPRPLVCRTLVT